MTPTLESLRERLFAVPALLEDVLAHAVNPPAHFRDVESWDVVGVGASEGPARLTVGALFSMGRPARLRTPSCFLDPDSGRAKSGLLVFSQGLSPNAQLALRHAGEYGAALLVTAVTDGARPERMDLVRSFPGHVQVHPPAQERGTLVRLAGPPCAALVGLRIALALAPQAPHWQTALPRVPQAYRNALERPSGALGGDPVACLGVGEDAQVAHFLMWKWQEGLYTRLPVATEVLSFAHGPLQSIYEQPCTVCTLERQAAPQHAEMWTRLRNTLHPKRHRVVSLPASLSGPLAFFEFDAALGRLLLEEARARGIAPGKWPGQGADEPLYALCDDAAVGEPELPPR